MSADPVMHTVGTLAALLHTSDEQIIAHIRAGRLKAVNVGNGTQRPRWRISPEAVEEFLRARTVPPKPVGRRKRRGVTTTEFF